tara:strand:+ start:1756 stop:2064 length:309 start_codon:yes stop_codon:yes gene_type:complete
MRIFRFFFFLLLSISNAFIPNHNEISLKIVKSTSGMLANADSVGHRILNSNKLIIDFLLDHKEISMEIKKPFILFLIETAQMGDSMGSQILETYYNLVDKLL